MEAGAVCATGAGGTVDPLDLVAAADRDIVEFLAIAGIGPPDVVFLIWVFPMARWLF